jgi:hypothetical protein
MGAQGAQRVPKRWFPARAVCSGQSNMCFSLNQMTGATAEIALAGAEQYEAIRLMTVAPTRADTPQADLAAGRKPLFLQVTPFHILYERALQSRLQESNFTAPG